MAFLEQAVALDSTFAVAWASLSIALTRLYTNGFPSPELAGRAKEALDRAVALSPDAPQSHLAAARYRTLITRNANLSASEMDLALRSAPNDAEVLSAAGLDDVQKGDFGSALAKLERAREIDPRSYTTLYNLGQVYDALGRTADAEAAAAAALVVRPGDLAALQWISMMRVAQGNMAGARDGLRAAAHVRRERAALAAQFAGFQENTWILDPEVRALVFRLTPSAFDGDRAWWGQSLSSAYWQSGDLARARAYADSAIPLSKSQADGAPNDPQLRVLYGLVLAYAGKATEARAAAELALKLEDKRTGQRDYILLNAVRIELALGNKARALDYIEQMHATGGHLTPAWLTADPTFASC